MAATNSGGIHRTPVAGYGRLFLRVKSSWQARSTVLGARADAHGGTVSALPPGSGTSNARCLTDPRFHNGLKEGSNPPHFDSTIPESCR